VCRRDVTVQHWTVTEIRALRLARRMSVREFAAHLGVSARVVSRWETTTAPSDPRPINQAALDTSLAQADQHAQHRFAEILAQKPDHGEHN